MRWPYNKRVDPVHAWGAIATGIAIATAFYAARALNPRTANSWLWPTNLMVIPVIVIGAGLILLFLPVRRSRREPVPGDVRGAWPELPPNHVERRQLLGRLRAAHLDGTSSEPRRVGVWGMGGSGKSVLAAAVRQDRAVCRRFPDGLTWVRLEPPDDPMTRPGMLAQRQQQLVAMLEEGVTAAARAREISDGNDQTFWAVASLNLADDDAEPAAADIPAVDADVDPGELIAAQLPQVILMHDASHGSQVRSCSREPPRGDQHFRRGQDAHHYSMGTRGAR